MTQACAVHLRLLPCRRCPPGAVQGTDDPFIVEIARRYMAGELIFTLACDQPWAAPVNNTINYRIGLDKFDGHTATYRSHIPGEHPTQFIGAFIDRERFNKLGKPGYIDVTITVPEATR